jgi:putative protease
VSANALSLFPAENGNAASGAKDVSGETDDAKNHLDAGPFRPEILSPAGDMPSALAGLAAGADAVYLGLKHFSARMQAENFSTSELAALADLAHAKGRRVYVAMNTLIKPGEAGQVLRLIRRLVLNVEADALILQDPAVLDMAGQAGFQGELHLSTLANVTHPKALTVARSLGAHRAILPRELSLPEVRRMDESCPQGLSLEIFVHGALCFCVSGRCWWSSYLGGKSGLRGRCVQPCRRVYAQKSRAGRFFSCMDLSLDTLVHSLLSLTRVRAWKIEGRKKGAHYVHHVTAAYRLLRDEPGKAEARQEAERLIGMALGRLGTRSLFVPGKAENPAGFPFAKEAQTSSGLLCGRIGKDRDNRYEIKPRLPLLPRDFLRVGCEDEPWHCTLRVGASAAAGASLVLSLPGGKHPKVGVPVFLIDRKEAELVSLLNMWGHDLRNRKRSEKHHEDVGALRPSMPIPSCGGKKLDVLLRSSLPHGREGKSGLKAGTIQGLWLSSGALRDLSKTLFSRVLWWLPPVIWPDEEDAWSVLILAAMRGGARRFVCNTPWQAGFFSEKGGISLVAGPFCNTANASAIDALARIGFEAAVISPELGEADMLALPEQSPLPLGVVLDGFWPMGISRHRPPHVHAQEGFLSPKGEEFWLRRYGRNTWIYPSWPLNLAARRADLERAGYTMFIHMDEHPPKTRIQGERESEFNWKAGVL